ncbi:sensor histidine kinase [Brachybacterium sp.]|uniref:sensor histidine kinase n=1 Tax=Brachybacterium sp. TaxID=1891286 RepID=UPI002ED268CE
MAERIRTEQTRRSPRPLWLRGAAVVADLLLLGLLLAMDFELGVRLLPPDPGIDAIGGSLATALVAVIAAVIALLRRVLPPRATVGTILALSLLASLLALFTDHLSPSLTEAAALLVATAVGIRAERSPRGAIVVAAGTLLAVLAAVLLRLAPDATATLLGIVVWGCAVTAGIAARHLRSTRETALEDARRAERMELARELHDVVAHQVSGIIVQAQAANAVASGDAERAAAAFSAIEAAGAEALSGMRRMVGAIRDDAEHAAPLTVPYGLADVPALVDSFDPSRERTLLTLEATDDALPSGLGESAYLIIREALTNVRRHAPGGRTRIDVRRIGSELVLEIRNDGVRHPPRGPRTTGYGLTGIAERVAMLGGRLDAGPDAPGTWTVRAHLPTGAAR